MHHTYHIDTHPNFYKLLDEVRGEISRRDGTYLQRFPLQWPPEQVRLERYAAHPVLTGYSGTALELIARDAFQYLGAPTKEPEGSAPARYSVSKLVIDSTLDAFAAAEGAIDLAPAPSSDRLLAHELIERYEHRVSGGRRYAVRHGSASRPILLIPALGVPITVWSRFLADPGHDLPIIVAETRCGNLVEGGMHDAARLDQHAEDLEQILDAEGGHEVDIVTWCNGGRIAVNLAAKLPERVSSLTLVCTTWRGLSTAPALPCPFEDALDQIFRTLKVRPALLPALVQMIRQLAPTPDWEHVSDDEGHVLALAGLPAAEHRYALLAPMRSGEFLINYGLRAAADEAYPIDRCLAKIDAAGIPILLITGEQDNVVSNALTREAFQHHGRAACASLSCAGHYVHDLQYPYFRWLLKTFIHERRPPTGTARVLTAVQ